MLIISTILLHFHTFDTYVRIHIGASRLGDKYVRTYVMLEIGFCSPFACWVFPIFLFFVAAAAAAAATVTAAAAAA